MYSSVATVFLTSRIAAYQTKMLSKYIKALALGPVLVSPWIGLSLNLRRPHLLKMVSKSTQDSSKTAQELAGLRLI